MRFGKKVVGATLYRRLNEDVLLNVNGTAVTRQVLIEKYKCGNFAAAKNLARVLSEQGLAMPDIADGKQLEALAREDGVGVTTLYVALCLMRPEQAKAALAELDVTLPTVAGRKEKK